MTFNMDSYVDVAERERLLFERYPDARVQVDLDEVRNASGELVGWKAKATVWRSPEDTLSVWDWAVEQVPGKTPFTRDSEAMNASTSAVGRAIVLAGFETKKIASADDVRNRSVGEPVPAKPGPTVTAGERTDGQSSSPAFTAPELRSDDEQLRVHFGKNQGTQLGSLTEKQLSWYANQWEPGGSAEDIALKAAARRMAGAEQEYAVVAAPDFHDGIPFGASFG